MTGTSFEIRQCRSCGLRYPLVDGQSFGARCPHCLGETIVLLQKRFGGGERKKEGKGNKKQTLAVLLDNIRSAWNVGSIFRSADGFGFEHVYLCGITPTPESDAVRKTALGADEHITWSSRKDAVKLAADLKMGGWKVIALEGDVRAVPVSKLAPSRKPFVLILGSEVTGVDPELLDLADQIVSIPMHGRKRSLNVAVAFGVAGFALSS
ncbi:MAG: RNA methyltransferase [Chloroflexi bacterium]|nr:RNA methyltransferase [Chloroflexota bacterium]